LLSYPGFAVQLVSEYFLPLLKAPDIRLITFFYSEPLIGVHLYC